MKKLRLISWLVLALVLVSCERDGFQIDLSVGPRDEGTRKVMLLYGAGFNSLSGDIKANIDSLKAGYLPGKKRNDDVILVLSHVTTGWNNFGRETAPVLFRMYAKDGNPVLDTLKTWPVGTPIANAGMVTEVLDYVRTEFPAAGYGAIFSTHATGWLPEGYYSNPRLYEGNDRSSGYYWTAPRRRSIGQEYFNSGNETEEIELHDLAAAIPYHLDYILFDACLMATVEVAWALKDVCSYLAVSPCEIPAAGFRYKTLAEHLLKPETPDLKAVCEDYFAQYEHDSVYGATITMVDCNALQPLADACRPLFDRYRSAIRELDGRNVQVYDRQMGGKYYYVFFDLLDILREAGATESERASVQAALDKALVYEAHTSRFISINLDRCCGLAMYLPSYPNYKKDLYHGTRFLDGFYKENIAWNKATLLVE